MAVITERLLLNHAKTLGFLAPRGEEFNPGPETRLDRSELLCNKVLLKYKGDFRVIIDLDTLKSECVHLENVSKKVFCFNQDNFTENLIINYFTYALLSLVKCSMHQK